jgi:hypothetical protein
MVLEDKKGRFALLPPRVIRCDWYYGRGVEDLNTFLVRLTKER